MAAQRRRIVWTSKARVVLDEVLTYIAGESRVGAQRVLHAAIELAGSLESE